MVLDHLLDKWCSRFGTDSMQLPIGAWMIRSPLAIHVRPATNR
jgi:hypothetical protein